MQIGWRLPFLTNIKVDYTGVRKLFVVTLGPSVYIFYIFSFPCFKFKHWCAFDAFQVLKVIVITNRLSPVSHKIDSNKLMSKTQHLIRHSHKAHATIDLKVRLSMEFHHQAFGEGMFF